jgi:hypothetical protein
MTVKQVLTGLDNTGLSHLARASADNMRIVPCLRVSVWTAVKELALTLADVLECGDMRGHIVAWWEVVTGKVTPDSRG